MCEGRLTFETNDTVGIYLHQNSFCGSVSVKPRYVDCTPKAACINGMWDSVLDVGQVKHAQFQLDQFRGFGAPGGRKSLSPFDWRYRPNVLHCYYHSVHSLFVNSRLSRKHAGGTVGLRNCYRRF